MNVLFGEIILRIIMRYVFRRDFVVLLMGRKGIVGKMVKIYYIVKVRYFWIFFEIDIGVGWVLKF